MQRIVQALLAIAALAVQAGASTGEVPALINTAVAADPADAAPRLALISHYIRANEPKLAVTGAQDALTAQPDKPEIMDAAARAYRAAGGRRDMRMQPRENLAWLACPSMKDRMGRGHGATRDMWRSKAKRETAPEGRSFKTRGEARLRITPSGDGGRSQDPQARRRAVPAWPVPGPA